MASGCDVPVILHREYKETDVETLQIKSSADLGGINFRWILRWDRVDKSGWECSGNGQLYVWYPGLPGAYQ